MNRRIALCAIALASLASACSTSPGDATPRITPANAIATGDRHSCALSEGGVAYCWGANEQGQLGNGTVVNSSAPGAVAPSAEGPLLFVQIAAQTTATCGVTRDHTAYCWGGNSSGQAGNGTTSPSVTTPTLVAGGLHFTSINPGASFVCGLTTDGATYCWGGNLNGKLAIGNAGAVQSVPAPVVGAPTFQSITSGLFGTCGLTAAGAGYCWGNNALFSFGIGNTNGFITTPTPISGGHTFTDLQAGAAFGCGRSDVWYCWGTNLFGGLGMGSTLQVAVTSPAPIVNTVPFVTVIPGTGNNVFSPSCGLTAAGAAYCWGANTSIQLGTIVAAMESCTFNALTFGCTGTPTPVTTTRSFTALRIGNEHVCAIATTHEVVCWGLNDRGQLGNGTVGGTNGVPTVVAATIRTP